MPTAVLLSGGLECLWEQFHGLCRSEGVNLHYVTAYELFLRVRGVEMGNNLEEAIGVQGSTHS